MAREAVAVNPNAAPALELLVGISIERFKSDEARSGSDGCCLTRTTKRSATGWLGLT